MDVSIKIETDGLNLWFSDNHILKDINLRKREGSRKIIRQNQLKYPIPHSISLLMK